MPGTIISKIKSLALRPLSRIRRARFQANNAAVLLKRMRNAGVAGYLTLLTRFAHVYFRRRFSMKEIETLDLMKRRLNDPWFDLNLSKDRLQVYQNRLNPKSYRLLTADKIVFYEYCRGAGLRVPRYFGRISIARANAPDAYKTAARVHFKQLLREAGDIDFIIKPALGVYGQGVIALRLSGDRYVDNEGVTRSSDEIYDLLAASGEGIYVLQERLFAHPEIATLTGTSNLQTVRMATYVNRQRHAVIVCCQMKIIGSDLLTDNFADGRRGNFIADIPKAGGQLSQVFRTADAGYGTVTVETHPRTNAVFRDFALPHWSEACELVRSAALAFLPLRTIGWDVAITKDGPILIEGNETWDPTPEGTVGPEFIAAVRADGDSNFVV